MNLLKKSVLILSGISLAGVTVLYLSFLFLLPKALACSNAVKMYQDFVLKKTGLPVKFVDFSLQTKPDLSFEFSSDKIIAQTPQNKPLFEIDKINYKSKRFSVYPKSLDIDNFYADIQLLKPYLKPSKKSAESKFKIDRYPILNVKKGFIKLDEKSNIAFDNIKSKREKRKIITNFNSQITVPYTQAPLFIGESGQVIYDKEIIFDNLTLRNKNTRLYLDGKLYDLNIKGKNVPAGEVKSAFLYYYKQKHPNKKNFIENFHNLSGNLDIDLNLSKKGLNGISRAKNTSALFMRYKIPMKLDDTDFNFTGRKIVAQTTGTLGGEAVKTDFLVTGIATKNLNVSGNVYSNISDKFTAKYFPIVNVAGTADVHVKYNSQNGITDVMYDVKLPEGSNLLTRFGNIGNIHKKREIYAYTKKIGDVINIENYKYSFVDNGENKDLLTGKGAFEKVNGHYTPSNLTLKTNGNLPVFVIQPLIENYFVGGTFNADLNYQFKNKILSGYVNLFDVSHEDYLFLKTTNLNISNDVIKLNSQGTFLNSPLEVSVIADNNFRNNIIVKNIDIHLKKFLIKKGKSDSIRKAIKTRTASFDKPKRKYDVTVQKGKIRVDEIVHSKFYLHDVEIDAKLKNRIVDFIIPETDYAKGILSAKGSYNLANHSSNIYFFASDIDSNEVASKIFNLYNQIEGSGFATLHLKTENKLNRIHAHATFAVTDGYLPKLGSREFIINKSSKHKFLRNLKKTWKFSLEKITNIDFSKKDIFYSNLRGSFIIDNSVVHSVKIFSQSDYLSMFIEGNYDISDQHADLYIWGRHNKTEEKKIKIFKIPLSLIYRLVFKIEHTKKLYEDKLAMIPPIKVRPADIESVFRVFICGDLNSDNLKVILKDLR